MPYRTPGEEKYPATKRNLHKYVSAHDANILEWLHTKWSVSKGIKTLYEKLFELEGIDAKMICLSQYQTFFGGSFWLFKNGEE